VLLVNPVDCDACSQPFHRAGAPLSDAYELADTEIVLKHMHWRVIERVSGQYFVPVQKP
jgi:hypothetical protein